MTVNPMNNRRGIALFVTLAAITVMVAITLELHRKMRSAVLSSAAGRDAITLKHMAASGIQGAMAMLIQDKKESEIDSVQEDWANPESVAEVMADLPFADGNITVTITDERSRIQVNALVNLPGHGFNPVQFRLWDRFLGALVQNFEPLEDVDRFR
ncbi:MAG: general secretion pathway protein GspK [Deltaproteobacteria bacterium]|nr:general secretion pathway protein GspK [Deltaproteobacteria bacterium]